MRRIIVVIIFTLFINLFVACDSYSDSKALQVCGSYAVPGMFNSDLKGTDSICNVIETDDQGRILYEYTAANCISGNRDTALVICQMYNSDFVYFYEDECWLLSDYDQTDVMNLKSRNDWGLPLNQGKMSKRQYNITVDLFIRIDSDLDYSLLRSSCSDALDVLPSQIKELSFIDKNNGKELYWLSLDKNSKCYLILSDKDFSIKYMEITNNTVIADELSSFKQENNWFDNY